MTPHLNSLIPTTDAGLSKQISDLLSFIAQSVNDPAAWPLEPRDQAFFIKQVCLMGQRITTSEPYARRKLLDAFGRFLAPARNRSISFNGGTGRAPGGRVKPAPKCPLCKARMSYSPMKGQRKKWVCLRVHGPGSLTHRDATATAATGGRRNYGPTPKCPVCETPMKVSPKVTGQGSWVCVTCGQTKGAK